MVGYGACRRMGELITGPHHKRIERIFRIELRRWRSERNFVRRTGLFAGHGGEGRGPGRDFVKNGTHIQFHGADSRGDFVAVFLFQPHLGCFARHSDEESAAEFFALFGRGEPVLKTLSANGLRKVVLDAIPSTHGEKSREALQGKSFPQIIHRLWKTG